MGIQRTPSPLILSLSLNTGKILKIIIQGISPVSKYLKQSSSLTNGSLYILVCLARSSFMFVILAQYKQCLLNLKSLDNDLHAYLHFIKAQKLTDDKNKLKTTNQLLILSFFCYKTSIIIEYSQNLVIDSIEYSHRILKCVHTHTYQIGRGNKTKKEQLLAIFLKRQDNLLHSWTK